MRVGFIKRMIIRFRVSQPEWLFPSHEVYISLSPLCLFFLFFFLLGSSMAHTHFWGVKGELV
jgi:hypothetical protein